MCVSVCASLKSDSSETIKSHHHQTWHATVTASDMIMHHVLIIIYIDLDLHWRSKILWINVWLHVFQKLNKGKEVLQNRLTVAYRSALGSLQSFFFSHTVDTINRLIIFCHFLVDAGSFRVSVIHWTLTWSTGSLTCVRDHAYACVYTRGLGTLTASQHNIFDSEKLTSCSCAPDGSPMLYLLSHPVIAFPFARMLR